MLLARPQMEDTRRHRVIVGDSLDFWDNSKSIQKCKEENAAMEYDCYLSSPQGTQGCLSRPLFSCSGSLDNIHTDKLHVISWWSAVTYMAGILHVFVLI